MLDHIPFMQDFGKSLRHNKSLQGVIAIIVISGAVIAGWWTYSFYTVKKTEKAQQVFVDCFAEFEKNIAAQPGQARGMMLYEHLILHISALATLFLALLIWHTKQLH